MRAIGVHHMGITSKLLKLYRVDQQIRGLSGRLRAAERYLEAQDRKINEIIAAKDSLQGQLRQLEATSANNENETTAIDERVAMLRERMNNAATSKEHSALLVEINTLKADKSVIDERSLEMLTKIDELRGVLTEHEAKHEELVKVRAVAEKDRDERHAEVAERLNALEQERKTVVDEVPAAALSVYNERLERGVEDAMAPVSEEDRRNMEYACGSCYTHLPIESVNVLLNRSGLVTCPSCMTILYMDEDLSDSITTAAEKRRKKRAVSTSKDA